MGLQSWKKKVVTGASKAASLISRPFRLCLGVGKEELGSLTGSTFPSNLGKEGENSSGCSHGSSGSLRSQGTSISHPSQQDLSGDHAICDLPLGFGQTNECPEDRSEPSLQPGPGIRTLENSPTQCGQMKLDTTATAREVPSEVDATRAKAIPAGAAPKIPYDLAGNGHRIIYQASLPADLPVVGEGAQGRVLLGNLDEQAVAIKLPLSGDTGAKPSQRDGPCWAAVAKEVLSLQHEFEILQNFRHPNIVGVLGTVVGSEAEPALAGIILRFFPLGSMGTLIRGGKQPSKAVKDLAIGLFKGLEEMHKNQYCHFDVKLDNVLVSEEGGKLLAVLADLRTAKRADPEGNYGLTIRTGTPGYAAPEMMQLADQAGPAADMYSAGVTLMAMLTGSKPLATLSHEKATEKLRKEFHKLRGIDKDLKAVILKCLLVDNTKRPTSEAAVKLLEAAERTKTCSISGDEVIDGKSRKSRRAWWDFQARRQVCPRGTAKGCA